MTKNTKLKVIGIFQLLLSIVASGLLFAGILLPALGYNDIGKALELSTFVPLILKIGVHLSGEKFLQIKEVKKTIESKTSKFSKYSKDELKTILINCETVGNFTTINGDILATYRDIKDIKKIMKGKK